MEESLILELGIVLVIAFFAALGAKRIGQPVISGYIAAGLIIGPFGLAFVKNVTLLESFSEIGIALLMFFLGIEFSISKFKKIKNAVIFIGTYEVVLNLAGGFVLGSLIGVLTAFSFKEKLFFACIIALSSSGVVAKLLFDMRRTASKDSEILMGVMVYEDFIAVVILGLLSSISYSSKVGIESIAIPALNALLFYTVFILLGILLIHKLIDYLASIESQELFTALMLGLVFLTGSLAYKFHISSAAGAFLLGMIITSFDVEQRLHRTVAAFKDIFLIVFFISFGMLLDFRQIPSVIIPVGIAVFASTLLEITISTSGAFFSGLSAKKAFTIGTSMIARGEYSMIYAALGLAAGAISNNLYQFTGIYVFAMILIAPIAMKNSDKLYNACTKITPKFFKKFLYMLSRFLRKNVIKVEL
jgi:CPA2 family monovalent cation:H+ antiporter-2